MKKIPNVFYGALLCSFFSLQGAFDAYKKGAKLYYGKPTGSFISRWSFQELCAHIFDPRRTEYPTSEEHETTFNPADVKLGDLIFVRNLDLFMKTMHPHISVPYLMVTHGNFLEVSYEENLHYLDDEKIIAWFSIHPPKQGHPKYYPIPLGVYQKKELFLEENKYREFFNELRKKRKNKLLTGLFIDSFNQKPERAALAKVFEDKSFYTPFKTVLSFDEYMKELASSVFTLSPRTFWS